MKSRFDRPEAAKLKSVCMARCGAAGGCYLLSVRLRIRLMEGSGGPGRGRPPKNSVWSYELGRYVSRKPRGRPPPRGMMWSTARGKYMHDAAAPLQPRVPPPIVHLRSWNSDEMNEAVLHVGPRQNPYRNCTRQRRDVSGQYQDGYYAPVRRENHCLVSYEDAHPAHDRPQTMRVQAHRHMRTPSQVPAPQVPAPQVPDAQVPDAQVPAPIRRAFSSPPIPSTRRQLSDQAIELLTTGLNGLGLHDDIPFGFNDLFYHDNEPFGLNDEPFGFDLDEPPFLHTDVFMRSIHAWYEQKTEEEKAWLNTNDDAPQMMALMLNGFDNLMKVNGVSREN